VKTLSLLGQEISTNRVKTWVTYVGLDLVLPPAGMQQTASEGTPGSGSVATDVWKYKISGVPSYVVDPAFRMYPDRVTYPDTSAADRQFQQFSMLPFLQAATFPSLTMSHVPAEATADGIRAGVTVVFVNPVSNFATSTVYDTLSETASALKIESMSRLFMDSNVLQVGAWLGLFTRFYLPETLTREAWKGIPWVPFEGTVFSKPLADSAIDWDYTFPDCRDPWFVGRIASIDAVGETITVKATNQESGFIWPRIAETGTFLPSRGERIPIIYGFANHYSTPILDAPWHGTLASNLNDTQTDGINLSPPFDGLPSYGNLWIGGERISYTSVDRSSGLLAGVSLRKIGGVEVGSATFHNAGAAVFAEGPTRIVLGTDEMSGISSLYVRANTGEVPVRISSGHYRIETKTAEERQEIGSGTTEAVFTPDRFADVIQLYQRATLSRQPILNAPGVTLVEVPFGPDTPDPGDKSPWGRFQSDYEWARGDEEKLWTQDGKLIFPSESVFSPNLLEWSFNPETLEVHDDAGYVQMFAPAVSAPAHGPGRPNAAGYMRVFWPLNSPTAWSEYSTYRYHWVTRIEFSYDLTISAIETEQEFVVYLIGGSGDYYDAAPGQALQSINILPGETGTHTLEWTLDVKASGVQLEQILETDREESGTRFVVVAGSCKSPGEPNFTWDIEDESGDIIGLSGTLIMQESGEDLTENFPSSTPTINAEASDDGEAFFAALNELSNKELLAPIWGLYDGKFQFINNQQINRTQSFDNPDSYVTGDGDWILAMDYVADFSGVSVTTECVSWQVKVDIEGSDRSTDLYDMNFRIEDNCSRGIGSVTGWEDVLGTDINVNKYDPTADTDKTTRTFTSGRTTVRASGDYGEKPISEWTGDLADPLKLRISCQMHYDTGDHQTTDPYRTGAEEFPDAPDPDDRPQIAVTVTWILTTSSSIPPPPGRGENVDQIPGAIVAHPGALDLEFFADGKGPLAVLEEEIDPSYTYTDSWQDFAALDSANYGAGTVITNPTDILKRWAQKSETLISMVRPGPLRGRNPWSADYDSGTWEASEENLNEHYRIFAYDSDAPYLMGFDARNLGGDWESVLARIAFEARTNIVRSSGASTDNIMPFRFLSAGRAPSFSFPAVAKQIDVNEVLEFNYLGKRASDFANMVSANYDPDDSRLGNADDAMRYRQATTSHPYGLVGAEYQYFGDAGFGGAYIPVTGSIGGTWTATHGARDFEQTAAESAFWVDFSTNVAGSDFQSITVGLAREVVPPDQDSTFLGSLTYRTPSDEWDADGDAGHPTINYTDYGLGDPTQGEALGGLVYFTIDLLSPPTSPPSVVTAWETFTDAWAADYEAIQGVRIGLDSTLGSVPSEWRIYSVTVSDSRNEQLITSLEQIGPRPIAYSLESHRGTEGAEDWRRYMENALSDSALMVEVVVETSVGWDVELGDVVTVDVPAQIIDEEVTPVAATVDIRVIGWERNSDGVALRGVIL